MKKKILLLSLFAIFMACSPKITYLGDYYGTTVNVDIYYDEKDIDKEYRTIGIARNEGDEFEKDNLEAIREEMIKKAREVGADAILIESIGGNVDRDDWDSKKVVEAKFLKYE